MPGPIMIFGFARSGTTLFRALLGAHSQVQLVNEPELVWGWHRAGYEWDETLPATAAREVLERLRVLRATRRHLDSLPTDVVERFLHRSEPITLRSIYETLLPRPTTDVWWGAKSLNALFYTDVISRLYPDAVFIHVIRDPRGAMASAFKKKISSGAPRMARRGEIVWFARRAMLWADWITHAIEAERQCGDNWINVRFEELMAAPETELSRVCGRLGIGFEPQMLDPKMRADDPVLATEAAYAHRLLAEPIVSNRAHGWRVLDPVLIHTIERFGRREMIELGYRPQDPELPFATRLDTAALLLRHRRKLRSALHTEMRKRTGPAGRSGRADDARGLWRALLRWGWIVPAGALLAAAASGVLGL